MRRLHRSDSSQKDIVGGLRACGVKVWIIGRPCDLLTYYHGRWLPMECKPEGHKKGRKDQEKQEAFLRENGVPKVTTLEGALEALK